MTDDALKYYFCWGVCIHYPDIERMALWVQTAASWGYVYGVVVIRMAEEKLSAVI